jgi:uncharacterized LabA/DUF88 family protein
MDAAVRKGRQNVLAETRLKIAVFIDFDNIEIGVKSTLGVQFDIGVVLEALKERGDVVSKIAYGDWARAGDYSRSLTQHATKLVQRNLTPGGDKNGADINLALDALEMAFTHGHINAYVIVGGDSDFITLVEKLKQYDKQIFVVGGRAFTSMVMQRNCHEFIAYENLVSSRRSPADRGRSSGPVSTTSIEHAVPLVRRALKVLADREVSPQLGLLKSTLLQLDSTFSERTYGAGSFRDFAQKLASAGHVTLREAGRNVLVELAEGAGAAADDARLPPQYSQPHQSRRDAAEPQSRRDSAEPPPRREPAEPQPEAAAGNGGEPRTADGIREVRRLFQSASNPPRWPMYIRQAKQFLRNVDASFDERKFGFASLVDLLRACQRDGLFRIERDRQGVMRVFPGNVMQAASPAGSGEAAESGDEYNRGTVADEAMASAETSTPEWSSPDASAEADVVEGDVVQEMNTPPPVMDGESSSEAEAAEPAPSQRRRGRGGRSRATPRADRKPHGETRPPAEGKAAEPRAAGEGRAARTRQAAEGKGADAKPAGEAKPRKSAASRPRAPRARARKETPVA